MNPYPQLFIPVKKSLLYVAFTLILSLTPLTLNAASKDDPLLTMVMVDQLEFRQNRDSDAFVLEGQAWIGRDLSKLWFKSELERVDGETEEAEFQALYSRAYSPNWDIQFGLRQDFQFSDDEIFSKPELTWAVLGFQGLSPYFFEIDSVLFLGENGRSAFRIEAEYELLLTQQLILTPEIEMNFYGQNDPSLGIGSGLSDIELGLRLRYEVKREFAPYIGFNWSKKTGKSASFSRNNGDGSEESQWVIGFRAWF